MTNGDPGDADAFGAMLAAHVAGRPADEVLERDDGQILRGDGGAAQYVTGPQAWPVEVRAALEDVAGPVLDVGAGAGRHAVALQDRGLEVVAIDTSPGALAVMRDRGVHDARLLGLDDVTRLEARFATVLLLGNNLGLLGGRDRAADRLAALAAVCLPDARIVAETTDPYATADASERAHHDRNRRAGRLGGHARMRARFDGGIGAWFDYLFLSADEVRDLVADTDWAVADITPVRGSDGLVVVLDLSWSSSQSSRVRTGMPVAPLGT